jgi:hypothetical protein
MAAANVKIMTKSALKKFFDPRIFKHVSFVFPIRYDCDFITNSGASRLLRLFCALAYCTAKKRLGQRDFFKLKPAILRFFLAASVFICYYV